MIQENLNTADKCALGVGKGLHAMMTIKGHYRAVLRDVAGNIKDIREGENTVTTAGKNGIADQIIASPTLAKPGWMELGTGTPGATLLGAYISGSRVALTSKTRSGAVVTMVADWAAGVGTGAITEAGVFDVATANTVNMWNSATFSVVNKAAGDTFQITWTLTIS